MFDRCKRKRLETKRQRVLSAILGERSTFETMVQRAQVSGAVSNTLDTLVTDVLERLAKLAQRAPEATNDDQLDDLIDDAELQGQLRAYICTPAEIPDEGRLAIDVMEEWKVPNSVIANLRNSLGRKLEDQDPKIARSALQAIFQEYDSWSAYIEEYEETMKRSTYILFSAISVLSLLAILLFQWPQTALYGLFFAGATGGCTSVMAKMPALDVTPSGDFAAYQRQIFSRISAGVIASLIGCALLGWGLFPISIQNQTFADALNVCTTSPMTSCTGLKILILLGVPMLFGFSERALTSFEQRVFGNSEGRRVRR